MDLKALGPENIPKLRDFSRVDHVGIQIDETGNRVWVCLNGICVLRVKGIVAINLMDLRRQKGE